MKDIFDQPVLNYNASTLKYTSASFDFIKRMNPAPKDIEVFLANSFFGSDYHTNTQGMYIEFDFGLSLPH